jgi:hypothetical protein
MKQIAGAIVQFDQHKIAELENEGSLKLKPGIRKLPSPKKMWKF